ncbi:MAG: hypothetical protein K0Q65_2340 [Clostridia bacterium]|jgi:CubicO group peptidase (beta-lactamase class C family)|nr:hypothetical protein [Clostridia bacterium]
MKRLINIVLALVLCASSSLTALAEENNDLLPSGMAYTNIEKAIDDYVEKHEGTTAAVSVAVFKAKDVLMEKAYGYTDIENSVVNDKDTVFEWGSITKLLTWTSVMQLVEKGKIDLNADIRTYLPEGFLKKLKYDTSITMLNLMNHNAGWQETVTDLFIEDMKDLKELGDTLRLIEPEQVFEPGKIVSYSNWGSALAGYIVERVSGQYFDDYVHEHIFRPLGMEHTALNATLSDNEWVVEKRKEQKCYTTENKSLGTSLYYLSLYPAGMATGTISDFIKFGQSFLTYGGEKSPLFEKKETLNKMLSPSLYFADGQTARNCHGFWTDELGVPVLWHNGGTIGSSSWFAFDPESGIGMITLTNQNEESIYNCGLLPLIFGKNKHNAGAATAEDISGMYVSARSCFKGFAKPYSLFSLTRFVTKSEGRYSVPGSNSTATLMDSGSYLLDMGGLKQYIFYSLADKAGNTVLQLPASDYVKVNKYEVVAKHVLLVLFILASLYAFFALIIGLIISLKNKKAPEVLGIYRAIVNSSVVIMDIMVVYISVKLFSGLALLEDILWSIILNGLIALVPVIYVVIIVVKWKKTICTKKEKIRLILTGAAGLIVTINVIFWQVYKFW